MKKLIIILFFILNSCSPSAEVMQERNLLYMIKENQIADIISMITEGNLPVDYTTMQKQSLLHLAIAYNNSDLLQNLVEQGVPLDIVDREGNTPLMYSIVRGNEVFAEALIDYQSDPNIQNKDGDTALILAAKKNMEAIMIALIDKTDGRMNPDIENYNQDKALNYIRPKSLIYNQLSHYTERRNSH